MGLYKLPLGIRIPREDEYPKGYDFQSINCQRDSARIMQGFLINEITAEKYTQYIEANIDADKLWVVFCGLAQRLFENEAYGIIGFKDEEPKLSKFVNVEMILDIFKEYKFELTNDGYLEFGIAYYDENSLNEVYVSSFKYMKIWTTKKDEAIRVFNSFGIQKVDDLQFIDEFPVVSEALSASTDKEIRHYFDVIATIEEKFEKLLP